MYLMSCILPLSLSCVFSNYLHSILPFEVGPDHPQGLSPYRLLVSIVSVISSFVPRPV